RSPGLGIEDDIEEMQANARNQNRRDRDQRERFPGLQAGPDDRALVLTKQPLDPLQRDRIDIPGVAMDQSYPLDPAIMRRVEAVIHARGQPQRDETSIAVLLHQRGIAKQVEQRVRRALDLEQLAVGDLAECADDAVAWTDHDRWVGINGPET